MPKRVRSEKISIDIPQSESEPWISLIVQGITEDEQGNITQVVPRMGQIHRRMSDVQTQMFMGYDPVTQQPLNVSMAGIASLITVAAAAFLAEDYDGTVDQATALVYVEE